MKRKVILIVILLGAARGYSQGIGDSIEAIIKSFRLSVEVGYNFLIPSATESDDSYIPNSTEVSNPFSFHYVIGNPWRSEDYSQFCHHQWGLALTADGRIVKWRLALRQDYYEYRYYTEHFQSFNLQTALGVQFYLLKKIMYIYCLVPR